LGKLVAPLKTLVFALERPLLVLYDTLRLAEIYTILYQLLVRLSRTCKFVVRLNTLAWIKTSFFIGCLQDKGFLQAA